MIENLWSQLLDRTQVEARKSVNSIGSATAHDEDDQVCLWFGLQREWIDPRWVLRWPSQSQTSTMTKCTLYFMQRMKQRNLTLSNHMKKICNKRKGTPSAMCWRARTVKIFPTGRSRWIAKMKASLAKNSTLTQEHSIDWLYTGVYSNLSKHWSGLLNFAKRSQLHLLHRKLC